MKIKLQTTGGTYFGHPIVLSCDGVCGKAWGRNNRPSLYRVEDGYFEPDWDLADDVDDYCYLSDGELGNSPVDPGTYEGADGKPLRLPERHNKWCCRECERCEMTAPGKVVGLTDFSRRFYNCAPYYREE